MSSKNEILESVRKNTIVTHLMPDLRELEAEAMTFDNKVATFADTLKMVGGHCHVLAEGEELNDVIRKYYPNAKRIASTVESVDINGKPCAITCGTFHPDSVEKPGDLDGTDLAIAEGKFGVSETAAVWVTQNVEQRTIYFIAEALVLIVAKDKLVNNMHEAYKLIDTGDYGFGVFISGPSKTADIEQALVFGAHGAADVTVILV